jgi:hypothetical protein
MPSIHHNKYLLANMELESLKDGVDRTISKQHVASRKWFHDTYGMVLNSNWDRKQSKVAIRLDDSPIMCEWLRFNEYLIILMVASSPFICT